MNSCWLLMIKKQLFKDGITKMITHTFLKNLNEKISKNFICDKSLLERLLRAECPDLFGSWRDMGLRRGLLIHKSFCTIIQLPGFFWNWNFGANTYKFFHWRYVSKAQVRSAAMETDTSFSKPRQCLPYWRVTKPVFELKLRYIVAPHRSAYEILRCVL